MTAALDALDALRKGNHRFVTGTTRHIRDVAEQRRALVDGQNPFAVILGCADSRAPAEHIFDQGLGDLFTIRVAGNVVAPSLLGSVEFAAAQLGTRLVVVLGHTQCGAVGAALAEMANPGQVDSPNLLAIIDRIRPAIEPLKQTPLADDAVALAHESVRANVRRSVHQLRQTSAILTRLIAEDGLLVVGAEYDLGTGVVDFFEGVPSGG